MRQFFSIIIFPLASATATPAACNYFFLVLKSRISAIGI